MKKIYEYIFIVLLILLAIFSYTSYRAHAALALHVSPGTDTPAKYGLKYQDRYFMTSDNVKIASWYIPVKDSKAVVILVHGFQSSQGGKALMLSHAQYLNKAGYSTLLIDLRSMGYTAGNKVTLGINEWKDAEAAYDYAKSLPENKGKKIGFMGNSMGAATSLIERGITGKGDFVIASVPYANFTSLLKFQIEREGLPPLVFYPFLRLSTAIELGLHYAYYSPANWVGKIDVPVFLISAAHDNEVNSLDAKSLYNEVHAPKEYWQANAGHDIYKDQPQQFKTKVLAFLSKIKS
ncbi:MAG TPA: alpha/beta hydrolase [Patescibacteria group bacterium]|nr:alpha/beta hydrolase [Patescibacteria group bacterium]